MTSLEHERLVCPRDLTVSLGATMASQEFKMVLRLQRGDSVIETVRRAMEANSVPLYLEPHLVSTAHRILLQAAADRADEQAAEHLRDRAAANAAASTFAQRLRNGLQMFHKLPAEPLFPKAFTWLLGSTGAALEGILQLEEAFARALADERQVQARESQALQERHAEEMDAADKDDKAATQALVARHIVETEALTARHANELAQLQASQRRAYHSHVVAAYVEAHPEARAHFAEYVDTPTGRRSRSHSRSSQFSVSSAESAGGALPAGGAADALATSRGPSPSLAATVRPRSPAFGTADPAAVAELVEMGFSAADAEVALVITRGVTAEAVTLLLEQPERIAEAAVRQREAKEAPAKGKEKGEKEAGKDTTKKISRRRTLSFGSSREKDAAPAMSGKAALTVAQSYVSSAVTSAFGRLGRVRQQLPGALGAALASVSGSAASSSSAAAVDDNSAAAPRVQLAESFSVQLGTQEKTSINLRLAVEPLLEDDADDPQRHMAQRAQTLLSLYSSTPTGGVIMCTPDALPRGSGLSKVFTSMCTATTEFHFDDLQSQLDEARELLQAAGRGTGGIPLLSPGDYFVTRHSNLPLLHVAFHLVGEARSGSELNNRSPSLAGLRCVLKAAHRYDIAQLSLPLLLCAEDAPIEESAVALGRRAEMVLKTVKAHLMEHQRTSKTAAPSSSDGPRFIQFLLPRATTPEQFAVIRSALTAVFRVN